VDSPDFDYRKVFWSAVQTILGNAAKAPFRAIGRLFGRDEDDLDLVEFDAGRSDLLPSEADKLAKLAEQIGPKQELTLTVEGRFDPATDRAAMKQAKLEKLIEARREAASAAAAANGASTLETILENLFVEQFSAETLTAERQRFTSSAGDKTVDPKPAGQPAEAATTAGLDAAAFYEALRARLLDAQTITDADLGALASARSMTIQETLIKSGAVEAMRVTVAQPDSVKRKKTGSARVASEVAMSAGGESGDN
jgi:hypothetical protein